MLDSVHLARWVSQFDNLEYEIEIFPSSKFRYIHPKLADLVYRRRIRIHGVPPNSLLKLAGYLDYLKFEVANSLRSGSLSRHHCLRNRLINEHFDIVHLIEIQHAGYLYLKAMSREKPSYKTILTNYGSDIFFYKSYESHAVKIRELLGSIDYYSAECRRDYELAKEFGFEGRNLPLLPNSGGFDQKEIEQARVPLSVRKRIYVKGYGGIFGLGEISLKVSKQILDFYPNIEVVVVSLTSDLRSSAEKLNFQYGQRVKIFTIEDRLSRETIFDLLSTSVLTLGISRSDGISTTFLEALVCGAIPIQTDTSCASEWIEKGFYAKVVPPIENVILSAAREILDNLSAFEEMANLNSDLANQYLSADKIRNIATTFYGEIGN